MITDIDTPITNLLRPNRLIDITGQRFGKLLVIGFAYMRNKTSYFNCICDCGKKHITQSQSLRNGHSSSCGCSKGQFITDKKITHGMCGTPIYFAWRNMLNRCEDPLNDHYKDYGGRGITVCEQWHNFIQFYEDVKEGYAEGLTLERIDNNGIYEKNNFKWATRKQQCRNRRSNAYLEYNGERLTHAEWAERLGFNSSLINHRLSYGWSVEKVLVKPIKQNK